jgi:hypothetical protein
MTQGVIEGREGKVISAADSNNIIRGLLFKDPLILKKQ